MSELEKKIKERVKKDEIGDLKKYCRSLEKELLARDKDVEVLLGLKKIVPNHKIIQTKNDSKISATAFLVYSDWHIDEIVKAKTVNFLNKFDLDVADSRINYCFSNSLRLLEITKKDVKLDAVVVILGGDFISGGIHEELLSNTSLRPVEAILWVIDRLHAGLKLLKEQYDNLIVMAVVGNHSRICQKQNYSNETGFSLEFFMYHMLAKMLPDIQFQIADGYHLYIELYNKVVRVSHGHAVRFFGGIGNIFPSAYKAISQWNKSRRADLDVWCHYHSTKNGQIFIQNGSLIGYNSFALHGKFDFQEPVQTFFLYLNNGMVSMYSPVILEKI